MRPELRNQVQALLGANRLDEARVLLERCCQKEPQDTEGWFLLSTVNGQLGRYEDVVGCCRRILEREPDHSGAYLHLGNAQTALGRFGEAIDSHRKALARRPNDPAALTNLGRTLFQAGEITEAEQCLRRALEIAPRSLEAQYNLASLLRVRGELKEAIARYEAVIGLNPRLHQAYRHLAAVLQQAGDYSRALETYQRALALQPKDAEACLGLGSAYRELGMWREAMTWFQRTLELKPDSSDALRGMADGYLQRGDLNAARETYQRALSLDPSNFNAQAGLAKVSLREGDAERAHRWAQSTLEAGKTHPAVVMILAKTCSRFGACDLALERIEQLTSSTNTPPQVRQALHFAAGEFLDRQEKYDAAFEHFHRANALSGLRFDASAHAAHIDGLIRAYSAEAMKALPRATHGSQRPVFIVGMPRSGTSLVEQILSSHPAVFGAGELNDVNMLAAQLPEHLHTRQPYPACLGELTGARLDTLAAGYLRRLQDLDAQASRVTDKMPHNYLHLGLINLLFPEARVIHCTRDPRDTCLSIYFQSFSPAHSYATNLANLGFYFREYLRLMEHWRRVLEVRMMEVNYEELVADVEGVSRRMVAFCGLDWDPACLEFQASGRRVSTASYEQVRQPVYTRSAGRWRHYARHLEPLFQALDGVS